MRSIRIADPFESLPSHASTMAGSHRGRSGLADWLATLPILLLVPALAVPFIAAAASGPTLTADPTAASAGATITLTGTGFDKSTDGRFVLDPDGLELGTWRAGGHGTFKVRVTVPPRLSVGNRRLVATDSAGAQVAATDLTLIPPTPSTTPAPTPTSTPVPPPQPTGTPSPTPSPAPTARPTSSPTSSPAPTPPPTSSPVPTPPSTPTPTPGAAVYVATAGSDTNDGSLARPWRTLAKAAATVAAGTTVYVRSGTYAPVTVTRSGTAGAPITFRSFPGEVATVAGDGSRATVILVSGAHDVVIRDLTVQGAPSQWGAGIRVDNSDRISVMGSVLRENRSFGLKIANSTNVTVAHNDIARNETGIELSAGGAGIVISDNDIHDNDRMVVNTVGGNDDRGANGIVLYRTTGSILVTGNRIWNNRAISFDYGFDGGAFEVYAASNITFRANVVWNNENVLETGTDGTLPCDDNRFERNVAYGGARTGPTMGMILRCASRMLVANNSFYGLDRFVFDVTASATSFGGSIDGLRIVNNAAIQSGAKVYSIDSAMPATVAIDHDAAFDTTGASIAYVQGHGNTASLATFRLWTGFEPAGIQADVRFADPTVADFRLGATSPAIDRGVPIPGTTDGFLGSAPDLGAIESTP